MRVIDTPFLHGNWTPAGRDRIDLSNAVEPDTAPTTPAPSWTERAEQAEQILAAAERDELLAAYRAKYAL